MKEVHKASVSCTDTEGLRAKTTWRRAGIQGDTVFLYKTTGTETDRGKNSKCSEFRA